MGPGLSLSIMSATSPPSRPTRLGLIRHGEPEAWARGRCCGRLNRGQSEEGLRQAKSVAKTLQKAAIDAIVSSPSCRAIQIAVPLASRLGLPMNMMPDLAEIDLGLMEGLTYEEAEPRFPGVGRTWIERP